jgi:hypothetical protein
MIGILITSHPGHCEIGLRECLKSVDGIGLATVFGYDDDSYECNLSIPTGVRLMLTGRAQEDLPHDWKIHQGEHLQIVEGLKILRKWGVRYVFKLCGDMHLKTSDLWGFVDRLEMENVGAITWEHPEGWLGTKAFFAEVNPLLKMVSQYEKITFLIESTYSKAAQKIGFAYKSELRDFWLDYVGGRC